MPVLEIRQVGDAKGKVTLDGGEWEFALRDPFSPSQEADLRWYFEDHLEFPMLNTHRAEQAAASIQEYGQDLFRQVFADPDLYAAFQRFRLEEIRVEIVGEPDFHRFHWETLWAPKATAPLAHRCVIARRTVSKDATKFRVEPAPVIRVLVVVARPDGEEDVGYRTISRPLVETLHQASLPVELDFVRPGTWKQLGQHLDGKPQGHYHVLHFDGHGVVASEMQMARFRQAGGLLLMGAPQADPDARRAFLFFENGKDGEAVEAARVADLVNNARIPVVILNACQSGKQELEAESNLASRLALAGVRTVLAMAYSVTVSAARSFMAAFYREAFSAKPLSEAATLARQQLRREKNRNGYFGLQVELEDWMLPVLYENDAVKLESRASSAEERAYLQRQAALFRAKPLKHRFYGRDLDILAIERRVLAEAERNILLLEGMGGTGKTTLLQHLGWWWQVTGLVSRVFVFEYDAKPWTRQQILFEIARALDLLPLDPDETLAQESVVRKLRAERHLVVLDNLESVTGEQLAVGQSLAQGERQALREFVAKLRGGKTLVLIGSRGKEEWLAPGTFDSNVHGLRGLDRESRTAFADEVLRAAGADPEKIRGIKEYNELLDLLAGHPLAMQVVLSNLGVKGPAEVLAALREGDVQLDQGGSRTESILQCIDYSHSNLSAEARDLLQCLAPFTGVLTLHWLEEYIQQLQAQPELAGIPWEQLPRVIQEAQRWGLVRVEGPFLHLQPVFPYFLRSRGEGGRKLAVERAFREHYHGLCAAIRQMQDSKEPDQRQAGQVLARMEFENALRALELSLAARVSVIHPAAVLSNHFDATQDHAAGLALAEKVLAELQAYPAEALAGPLGVEMAGALDSAAKRFLLLKKFEKAHAAYAQVLQLVQASTALAPEQRGQYLAITYHQSGIVAQAQRQWAEAEKNYREALRIKVEFNDRYSQAGTYHQLGRVAQEQRQWAEAEKNYREALRIFVEFNDRYEQAGTYHQLGRVAQQQRQWAEAEKNYREALRIKVEFNDRYSQASSYHQLGRVAQEQRLWAEAEKNYREALRICVEFNDRYEQASTYHNLGVVAQEQRQWAQAEKNYREALRIKVEFNDRYSQAITYHQLGRVAEEQRQWAEAEKNYREALRICVEFNDRYEQAGTYHQLGHVAEEQRQWAEAEKNYREALRIYVEFNDRYEQAGTYHQLGRVAEEQRQWAEADKNYREALRICVEFNDRYSQAGTYHQLGRVAQEQRQWAEAETHLLEALRLFAEYSDEHNIGIIIRSLARLSPQCPGLATKVGEILGIPADDIQRLFDRVTSPDTPPEADAAAT